MNQKAEHDAVNILKGEGLFVDTGGLLSAEKTDKIIEISRNSFRRIRFNDQDGSSVISSTQYIDHPLCFGRDVFDIVLNRELLSLLCSYFGEEPVLTSCRLQKKILPHKAGILPHRDPDKGIGVIHYFTDCSKNTGATQFYLGSHINPPNEPLTDVKVDDADYFSYVQLNNFNIASLDGYPRGTTAIFNRSIIHSVPAYSIPGRIVILSIYHPRCIAKTLKYNHLINISSIRCLEDYQATSLGLDLPEMAEGDKIILDKAQIEGVYDSSILRRLFWVFRWFVSTFSIR